MSQGAQILDVKYDTGKDRFFIADNDDIPAGAIVTAKVDSVSGRLVGAAEGIEYSLMSPDEVSAAASVGFGASAPTLYSPQGDRGSIGALIQNWSAAGTASNASLAKKISYNRTDATLVGSSSPDKSVQNIIRLEGAGATAVHWQSALSTSFLDTSARNVGVYLRCSKRTDGQAYSMARVLLLRDSAGAPDFTSPFGDWIFRCKADGKWRFYALTCTAANGYYKSSSSTAVFIPGTGATYAHARVQAPTAAECYELSPLPAGCFIDFGGIYLNPRGGKAAAVVRFDDCKSSVYLPNSVAGTGAFSTSFPSGFTGISGVSISAAAGDAMSKIDMVEAFGFKSTHYILCRHVGQQAGFATVEQLRSLVSRGHLVAFQSYLNPVGKGVDGVRLLDPYGKAIGLAGSITGVTGAVLTQSGHRAGVGTTRNDATGAQGFPVVFGAGGLPSGFDLSKTYWLRYLSDTTISAHLTEFDARNNVGAIDFTGATAASLNYTYAGSTSDHTGILSDYQQGKQWFIDNNFGDGYRYYALNQSAHDRYFVAAFDAFGEFVPALGGNTSNDVFGLTNAEYCNSQYTLDARIPPHQMMAEANITTDDLTTEAAVRAFVRAGVQEGAVIQNIGHDQNPAMFCWYLDELKYWSDAGLLFVGTHKEVAQRLCKLSA